MRFRARAALLFALSVSLAGCGEDDGAGSGASGGAGGGAGGSAGTSGISGSPGGSSGADAGLPRSFRLGFTPFPHDVTAAAVDYAYERLAADADLYAFHTTEGVPWVEALANQPASEYGAALRVKWDRHASEMRAHPDHAVYLGLTPLDDARAKLADYWGDQDHMPLPGAWASATFDSADVKAAYLEFCERAIAHYEPDFFAIGIEVNLLRKNAPASWPAYVELHRATYQALKQAHPALPIFVTFTAVDLLAGWTDSDPAGQAAALADLLPYTDFLALSFYPYMSAYLTNPIPSETFDQLAALAGGKPLAIAETGYPAQTTELPSFGLTFQGTPEKQAAWIALMLGEADGRGMPMVVNFVLRDYDALWQAIGGGEADAVWRDTGLYDENGAVRPAHGIWRAALDRAYRPR
jgi:hypothetical protein